MSSVAQDELKNLTNDQLRSRLVQHGLANMPVTDSTRSVLLNRLRKAIESQNGKPAARRETMHVTKYPTDDEKAAASKPGPASKKAANRRNTINPTPLTSDDIVSIAKPKNMRRSGRITPTFNDNGNAAPIAVPPSENDITELDEEPVRETYVIPKRTSRSPSLGKSQTVVTSYKTEIAKPIAIVESNEEDEDEYDEEDDSSGSNGKYKIYPSLPKNGFKNVSPTKTSLQSTLRRTTTHTTAYEPSSYKPLFEENYRDDVSFKAPLSKPIVPTYSTSASSSVNRRYTTSSFNSRPKYDDDSATEHSDIDAPYLSDFAKRLSQLRPEPLDRKIIADVKQHHIGNDSLWVSFSNLVTAFGRKFGTIILAGCMLMIVVFIYVFFIMA